MIRCVAFDFDGTLVDSNDIKRGGFDRIAEAHPPHGPGVMAGVLAHMDGDRRTILRTYAERMARHRYSLDGDALTGTYTRLVDREVAAAEEMPGALPLLRSLRGRGLRVYVNSATPGRSLLSILERRGWSELFDGVYGLPESKAENLRSILVREELRPTELLVVGDGVDDERAAKRVGCVFIPVGSGSFAVSRPEPITVSLGEVEELIERIRRVPIVPSAGAGPERAS